MTTIACDGEIMAADGQREHRGTITERNAQKIRRLPDGSLIGTAGDVAFGERVIGWFEAGCPKKIPTGCGDGGFTALICRPDGTVLICGEECQPGEIEAPFAVGSGMDYAIGAMAAGADPTLAVQIACHYDPGSGGSITWLRAKDD